MLTGFDWLRRSRSGAELLATLEYLEREPDLFGKRRSEEIGPPHFALEGPCRRCWVYPRVARSPASVPAKGQDQEPAGGDEGAITPVVSRARSHYCEACRAILARAGKLNHLASQSVVIWGGVNQLPRRLRQGQLFYDSEIFAAYIHDSQHFMLMMRRRELKAWLQELVLYHGTDLRGLIQVLPTTAGKRGITMSDILCRAVHHEGRFSKTHLRLRFFSAPHQLLAPHLRDRLGVLTFEISEFLSLLETAAIFRTVLNPETQEVLHELLTLDDPAEEQFYWGRFMGYLSPEAKDMLSGWRLRQWPKHRIKLLYSLLDYVGFY